MTVTSTNLIQGPATLWRAAFGSTEDNTAALTTPFADLGGTQDGVNFIVDLTFSDLDIDQVIDIPDSRLSKRVAKITTNLAEATLENMAIALNNTAPASGAFEFDNGVTAYNPTKFCYVIEGPGPTGKTRRIYLRKALQTGSPSSAYKKDGQTLIPVEFTCYWVSTSIKPVKVVDFTNL